METISNELSKFIEKTRFGDLPKDVVEISRRSVLDTIGCALAGASQSSIQCLEEFILTTEEGKGISTIIGTPNRASLLGSICLNASRADTLEYSDVNKIGGGHPGCMVVPTALGMGEYLASSGENLLLSVALGYEAHRVAIPLYPDAFRNGIHLVMFGGTFGAMATAGKLMGLTQKELKDAFGICAVVPVAPFEPCRVGGDVKDLYTGWAARTGVFSCLLAKSGFTGTESIFEGELGLYRALGSQKNPSTALEGIGTEWIIRATCVKPHASCRFTHSSVDASLNLVQQYKFSPQDIEHIKITTDTIPYQLNRGSNPSTPIDARFSIPYVVAVSLIKKRPIVPEDFSSDMLGNPEINGLAEKVEVKLDKSLDVLYPDPPAGKGYRTSIMKIRLTNGNEFDTRIDFPKGDPMNPVTMEEVVYKFRKLSTPLLGEGRTNVIVETILDLERLKDCRRLVNLLSLYHPSRDH
jgi:2-methylcitrate dehydratase PrpD